MVMASSTAVGLKKATSARRLARRVNSMIWSIIYLLNGVVMLGAVKLTPLSGC